MNTIKRRGLKAKRTPWAKTRSGRRSHARSNLKRAMIFALAKWKVNSIRGGGFGSANTSSLASRLIYVSKAVTATQNASAEIPVYGAKTA